jgi:hypothetical protein
MSRENSEIYSDRFPFMSKPPKVTFSYTGEIFIYILMNEKIRRRTALAVSKASEELTAVSKKKL